MQCDQYGCPYAFHIVCGKQFIIDAIRIGWHEGAIHILCPAHQKMNENHETLMFTSKKGESQANKEKEV